MTNPSKRGRGRTRKLTQEAEDTILRHLEAGGYLSHAAEAAGVNARTLAYWLEWGQEGKKPYAAFADKIMRARAKNALRLQSIVTRAALGHIEGDYRAACWTLERHFPKVYGTAAAHAAAVTVRTGPSAAGSGEGDDGSATTVQFYLPSNGRRPDDGNAGEDEA